MMTKPPPSIEVMDSLRGIAIFNVLMIHTYAAYTGKLPFHDLLGALAVPLFFAVSGFCITYGIFAKNHLGKQTDWKVFAQRRFHRIYPPYIIAVVLFFGKVVAVEWMRGQPIETMEMAKMAFFNVTLLQVLMGDTTLVNPAFWSLCVEMQFYLVVGILILAHRFSPLFCKSLGCVLIGGAGLVKVMTLIGHVVFPERLWFTFFPNYVGQFAFGASLAWYAVKRHYDPAAKWSSSIPALVSGLFLASTHRYGVAVVLVAAVPLYLELVRPASTLYRLIHNRVLVFLGTRSYSIYLIHGFGIVAMNSVGVKLMKHHVSFGAFFLVLTWLIAIGAGVVYYEFIEKRFLNSRKPA